MGWHHHCIRPLTWIGDYAMRAFDPQEKDVGIHVKLFSSAESKYYLGHDLLAKGLQPIQITIQNNTPYEYSISPQNIGLDHLDPIDVAETIKKSGFPRFIGFKVLGFIFWPFMIPGTIDALNAFHSHKSLKRDYLAKAIKEETIPVYSTLKRVIFVPQEQLQEHFTLTLVETKRARSDLFCLTVDKET